MHKLRLETWSSFRFLFESYRGTWIVTSKEELRVLLLTRSGMRFRHWSSLTSLWIVKKRQTLTCSILLYLFNIFC